MAIEMLWEDEESVAAGENTLFTESWIPLSCRPLVQNLFYLNVEATVLRKDFDMIVFLTTTASWSLCQSPPVYGKIASPKIWVFLLRHNIHTNYPTKNDGILSLAQVRPIRWNSWHIPVNFEPTCAKSCPSWTMTRILSCDTCRWRPMIPQRAYNVCTH